MHILNGQTESRAGKSVLPGRLSERSTMAGTLNDTPGSNRLHIGVFGKTNSGKSSFINAFTHQEVSIVADVAGTTYRSLRSGLSEQVVHSGHAGDSVTLSCPSSYLHIKLPWGSYVRSYAHACLCKRTESA
mgnify:CR=1 FL=1